MDAIDLQLYFPDNNTVTLLKATGAQSSRYTLQRSLPGAPTGMDSLYNSYMSLGTSGSPYMWRKEYLTSGSWCTSTYAVLFMGTDGSITEVGDWLASTPCTPNTVLQYKTAVGNNNTGLKWSGAGGLSDAAVLSESSVWRQNSPGTAITNSGMKAYSRTGLLEVLPTFTPAYGRDSTGTWGAGLSQTYTDVVHIVMYHGTKTSTPSPIRCVAPMSANGAYYQSYKDYDSYAMELWLAAGIGIIQENIPFIENGAYWGMSNCNGDLFQYPGQWTTYIDLKP